MSNKNSTVPAPSKLVSCGHYVMSPEVWDILPKEKKIMIEYDISPKLALQNKYLLKSCVDPLAQYVLHVYPLHGVDLEKLGQDHDFGALVQGPDDLVRRSHPKIRMAQL